MGTAHFAKSYWPSISRTCWGEGLSRNVSQDSDSKLREVRYSSLTYAEEYECRVEAKDVDVQRKHVP